MDIKTALALADNINASPALRALSLQLRGVEARSTTARKSADAAKAALDAAVREGMATSAEAKALVSAMDAVETAERPVRLEGGAVEFASREALDAAHEALGVDVVARTAHEGTC